MKYAYIMTFVKKPYVLSDYIYTKNENNTGNTFMYVPLKVSDCFSLKLSAYSNLILNLLFTYRITRLVRSS